MLERSSSRPDDGKTLPQTPPVTLQSQADARSELIGAAAILTGGISHLIITWLLYRKPRDVVRSAGSMIDRMMLLLGQSMPPRRTTAGTAGKRKKPAI